MLKAERRRPGSFDWRRTPGPSVLSALVGVVGRPFMPASPGAVQCRWGGGRGGSVGAELSALQLSPLCGAGAHLPALRSWQRLLRRGVCAGLSSRVAASGRGALSAHVPRCRSSCCPATPLPCGPGAESDASRIAKAHGAVQRIRACDCQPTSKVDQRSASNIDQGSPALFSV
jgi:hypothetical protein